MISQQSKKVFLKLLFASLMATVVALAFLFLFSLVASIFSLSTGAVKVFGVVTRLISVGVACFLFIDNQRGVLSGVISGLLTAILVQLLFFAFSGSLNWLNFAFNTLFCIIFALIFSIILVNLKNKVDYS